MSKLSQLTLPIKDPSTGQVALQTFDLAGSGSSSSENLPMGPLFSRTQLTAWKEKDWGAEFTIYGNNIWSDGENIYYSIADENDPINYVLDRSTGTWEEKDWSEGALTSFNGMNVWTDGTNVYYSSVDEEVGNFVLNKATGLWEDKIWGEFNNALEGYAMWTDGKFVYCSREGHYTLYLENGAWHDIIWTVEDVSVSFNPAGYKIWTDGNNIYFSDTDYYTLNLVLVKDSSSSAPSLTWKQKTWNGLTQFDGQWVWADGTNIYYADPNADPQIHYVLDTATSTWIEKDWNMAIGLFYPSDVWSDGNNIYYSSFDDSFERSVSYVLTGNIFADNTNLKLGTAASKDSGVANGVAELNSNGKVPSTQLPTFVGTTAQWNALTPTQQAVYEERQLTDDSADARLVDPVPTENSTNLVASGGVYADTQSIKEFVGKKLTAQTLSVGSTTLTFSDASITTDSTIEIFASVYGVAPTAVTVTTGQAVLTFDAQESAISVYLIVR